MIRKYNNHKLHTNPWHREEEPHNNHETPGKQTKQSNQLSLPHQDDAKLEWTKSNVQQNIEQLQTTTTGITINNKSQQQNHCLRMDSSLGHPGGGGGGGLNAFNWNHIFALDSAVVEV